MDRHINPTKDQIAATPKSGTACYVEVGGREMAIRFGITVDGELLAVLDTQRVFEEAFDFARPNRHRSWILRRLSARTTSR